MKKLTKLVLATSVAFSANAMAMQSLDDASLSATTGQEGLTIGIGISKIEIEKLFIHDNDGLTARGTAGQAGFGGTGGAGAIYIKKNGEGATTDHGVVVTANYDQVNGQYAYLLPTRNLADLVIDSDAGAGDPFINIAASVSGLEIHIGEIGVVASGKEATAASTSIRRGGEGKENAILSGLSLKTGPMSANIQLGAAPQGAMVKLSASMIGGLEIKDLGILDNSTNGSDIAITGNSGIATSAAGEIFIESIKLTDANSRDLALQQDISVFGENAANKGFIRIVSTSGAHDNYVKGIHLGSRDAASIGDVEIQGLQTYYSSPTFGGTYTPGAVITIAGH